jgi:hypothetical protein
MPTIVEHLQKRFKLSIVDGLPQATVEINGAAHWLPCCPLCGCTHQIIGVDENAPYTPLCQTQPLLFKAELGTWRKLYPEVNQYTAIHLIKKAA